MKTLLAAGGCLLGATIASAQVDGSLNAPRQQCEARLTVLQHQADTWRWIGIALAGIGGVVAAITGARAGAAERGTARKWGYAAVVAGGLAAITPLLPKAEEFQAALTLADRHYIVGLKVQRQAATGTLVTVEPTKYALARFTDCVAQNPPKEIPDLPEGYGLFAGPGAPKTNPTPIG